MLLPKRQLPPGNRQGSDPITMGVVDIFDKDKEGERVRKQLEVDFVVNMGPIDVAMHLQVKRNIS